MRRAFETLAVTAPGLFAGAMLGIGPAFGRCWASLTPRSFLDRFSADSGFVATTIPLVAIPTAAGVVARL